MRRIRVAAVEQPSRPYGDVEDFVLLTAVLCAITFVAIVLGAQLASFGLIS
jgi:hypothetical protein